MKVDTRVLLAEWEEDISAEDTNLTPPEHTPVTDTLNVSLTVTPST